MATFSQQPLKKAITFSYDDAVTQDIRMIELMNKYGLKSTFNLNSELLGLNRVMNFRDMHLSHYKIHPSDLKSVYEGHEVAVHTLTHPRLTTLDEAEIIRQVEEDRKNLEELVGYDIVGMAYPCGGVNNDERVAQIIKDHTKMQYCRTITSTGNFEPQENLYRFNPSVYHLDWDDMMRLGKEFVELKTDTPKIFYVWGHSYEMDIESQNWVRLEEFFELVSGHSDIFYGTNKEILLG